MNYRFRPLGALLTVSLALVLAGCGNGSKQTADTAMTTSITPPAKPASSAPFDRSFIDAMVPHHRSAIAMAIAAQKAGLTQPDLIGLATNIVDAQQEEIAKMLAWRKQWYGSAKVDPKGAAALGMKRERDGHSQGAGDLSMADDVDASFASTMIDHHKGAIAMAELAVTRATHPELKTLARQIIKAQSAEIATMKPHASKSGGMGGGMSHGG